MTMNFNPFSASFFDDEVRIRRLQMEVRQIEEMQLPIRQVASDTWEAHILVYEGLWANLIHKACMIVPKRYPYQAPIVHWATLLYPEHPNIYPTVAYQGLSNVCLSVLTKEGWRIEYTLVTVYDSLKWLLQNPNYHHGQPQGMRAGI